jgi:glycosyltransferase involved in cell wall biosynthesis
MRINILTARFGGPFQWGKGLTYALNERQIEARHIHTLFSLSRCPFYQNANIVHTIVPFPFRLWEKPIILTIKGDYTIERNMWQRFYPKTIVQADAITVPSQYLKQRLGLKKAIVIPNALFPERFSIVKHGTKDQLNLVSVMGFYFPDKVAGIAKIIDMLSKINSHHFKYTVIGGGQYLDTIKNQVSNTRVDITFTGFLPDPKPSLAASDIFLYYSYHDNFPNVILEAMACGLPVVTNNVGAVSEIIENEKDGYIATTDDAYLEYLLNLSADVESRSKIGGNARKAIEARFDWTKIVDRYIEIYKGLL